MKLLLASEALAEHVVDVLGVRFHRVTSNEAVESILHWMSEKSRRMVITAGPEFVMQAKENPELMRISRSADLVTADGVGVVWAAARMGRPVPERVTGVDLGLDIFAEAMRRNTSLRVYLLGASPESLQACMATLQQRFPLHQFQGHHGYYQNQDWPQILKEIESFQPHLWLVGLGQPRQEMLIYKNLAHLPPCVALGIGGSIDVWGGTIQRAPHVFRRLNLEWLYRLLKEPKRLRRQMALPRFAWQMLRQQRPYS